jgi:DNA-binding CsgD family transcriptional regulator
LDAASVNSVLAVAGHRPAAPAAPAGLTERELEVLTMVCRGRTSKQVASALGISAKTVNNHIERAYLKIGVGSRAAATLYLARRGLV